MLYRNAELERAFAFIRDGDWDIFCLQEVPEVFLKRLQLLPSFIAFRSERELLLKKGVIYNYVVTLSKHPIKAQGDIPLPNPWSHLPRRTHLFVRLMPFGLFTKTRNGNGLFVDVTIRDVSMRIFNLHLTLAQPIVRMREFEAAMIKRDPARPTVVCGDFNILESPHITPLNFFLGGHLGDALLYRRERIRIERHFIEQELTNPLRGIITHPFSQSQLDHILVSKAFSIKKAEVLKDRIGSDHCLIRVELA